MKLLFKPKSARIPPPREAGGGMNRGGYIHLGTTSQELRKEGKTVNKSYKFRLYPTIPNFFYRKVLDNINIMTTY